jgi:hypothetical protein
MQDRPNADELAAAVGEFLRSEVAPSISDPRLRFRVLIAANLMAILTRELQAGDEPAREEWRALAALLGTPGEPPASGAALRVEADQMARQLCARIRRGDADEGSWAEAALAHAEEALARRLQIANPRFLARVGG